MRTYTRRYEFEYILEHRGLGIANLNNMIYYFYKPIQKKVEKRKVACI